MHFKHKCQKIFQFIRIFVVYRKWVRWNSKLSRKSVPCHLIDSRIFDGRAPVNKITSDVFDIYNPLFKVLYRYRIKVQTSEMWEHLL